MCAPPFETYFFQFHALFTRKQDVRPPICDSAPHLENPGSATGVHVNDIQYLSQYRDRWHCQWVLFVFFFTLAVDFGKLRRTCQVIPNSKFFQVIFKQPRTEQNVDKQRTKQ